MMAGQHWSAATRSERIESGRGLSAFISVMSPRLLVEGDAARHEPGNGQKEISRLRGVGWNDDGLGVAVGGDETSIALLPSFKLPIEEGTARRVIRERGQMAI
jgi:hypothetical protein